MLLLTNDRCVGTQSRPGPTLNLTSFSLNAPAHIPAVSQKVIMINGVVVFYSLQRRFLYIMGTNSAVVRGPSQVHSSELFTLHWF